MQAPHLSPEAVRRRRPLSRQAAWWLAVVVVTAALLVLRRPDAVLNPQFYADDSHWFEQAYNYGAIKSLFYVYGGYLQVLSRLAAGIALSVPLSRAPLVLNALALLVEAAAAFFLVSNRMRNLGSLPIRCGLALLYLIVPKAAEVHANITNAPFNLAFLAFLIVIAEVPESRAGHIFDVVTLLLMGLTGPFCILLFPAALLVVLERRKVWSVVRLSLLGIGVGVQGLTLLLKGHERIHPHLGASFLRFCRIVAGQVVLPVLQGRNRLDVLAHSQAAAALLACLITVLTAALFVYAFCRGGVELRSFVLFASLLLAASLAFPTPNPTNDSWSLMQAPGAAGRYWYIPGLALIAVLVWLLGPQRPGALRAVAALLVCSMMLAATKHWRFASLPDLRYATYVAQFERLPPGTTMNIPINPPGWAMSLVKK